MLDVVSGADALQFIERHLPALVVCGAIARAAEMLAAIKQTYPAIFVIQAGGGPGPIVDSYLPEPVGPDELITSVRTLLRIKDFEAQLRAAETRRAFLHGLMEKLLDRDTVADVVEIAAESIGRFLGAYRAGLYRVASPDYIEFLHCWTSGYLPVFGGTESMRALGGKLIGEYRAARTVVVENIASVTSPRPHAYASIGAPVLRRGIWEATMFVHGEAGRRWTEQEVRLVEDVAQLTWDAVRRVWGARGMR